MVYEWDADDPDVVRVDDVAYRIEEIDKKVTWWWLKSNDRRGN